MLITLIRHRCPACRYDFQIEPAGRSWPCWPFPSSCSSPASVLPGADHPRRAHPRRHRARRADDAREGAERRDHRGPQVDDEPDDRQLPRRDRRRPAQDHPREADAAGHRRAAERCRRSRSLHADAQHPLGRCGGSTKSGVPCRRRSSCSSASSSRSARPRSWRGRCSSPTPAAAGARSRFVEAIAKWSMADVFVVALFIAYLAAQASTTAPGSTAAAARRLHRALRPRLLLVRRLLPVLARVAAVSRRGCLHQASCSSQLFSSQRSGLAEL